jgi:hypothetical protein
MKKALEVILIGIGLLVVASVLSLILAFPTMWLWNWALVPAIDSVNEINFMQALGINILCAILFKSTSSNKNK